MDADEKTRPDHNNGSTIMESHEDAEYKCTKCGCICGPEKKNPKHGTEPNTKFMDLPDDRNCSRCRRGKGNGIQRGNSATIVLYQ